jgi:hypothetical protein
MELLLQIWTERCQELLRGSFHMDSTGYMKKTQPTEVVKPLSKHYGCSETKIRKTKWLNKLFSSTECLLFISLVQGVWNRKILPFAFFIIPSRVGCHLKPLLTSLDMSQKQLSPLQGWCRVFMLQLDKIVTCHNYWTISEMLTFPHQLKLLGVSGWCLVANMISEPDVSTLEFESWWARFIKINCSRLLFHVCTLQELHVRESVKL